MASTTIEALNLDSAVPPPPRRPRVLLLGSVFASVAAAATFASLIGIYLNVRAQVLDTGERWLPEGAQLPLSPGNMAAVTLLMSTVTALWAVTASAKRDRGHTYLALGTTALFGLGGIVQIVFLYTEWNVILNGPDTNAASVLLFTITGAHIAMIAAGLIFLALMALRSLGGGLTGRDAEGLSAATLFWWVTVGLFMILWYAVYITK